MRKPDVYISYDLQDHEKEKDQFIDESTQSSTPFNIRGGSHPPVFDFFMDAEIIKSCNILIALVGKNTYQSGNVVQEVRIADGAKVPVFGVYLRGVDSNTEPPARLHRTRMTRWVDGWDAIGLKVAMCLHEQKNLLEEWLPPLPQTEPARPRGPLEESSLKKLEDYLTYQQKRDSRLFVSDEDVRAAARQLGILKSQAAIRPLVKCLLASSMFDDGVTFRDALVAIGRPALETLERTLIIGNLDGFRLLPGGPHRGFLMHAIDRIKSG